VRHVFADTLYWVAITNPRDPWRASARRARARLGIVTLVTTDDVLAEFLTALSKGGPNLRRQAAAIVRAILADDGVIVLPQAHNTFLDGLSFYESRLDKGYSLTDCISMNTMRTQEITEVLTNDHHFEQEGFQVLIR
jgi:uncharacterized protein